jgi:hypothetical protein
LQVYGDIHNLKHEPANKIIFVFLVFTVVSSLLSAVAFVTSNNLAFASSEKKDDSGSGGGDGSKDKGGGSGGSDNGGGGETYNSGSGGGDTSNTSTPPQATEGNTPSAPPTTEGTTPPPPAAATEQTCPDGSKPDPVTGNCPTPPDNSQEKATTPPPATGETTPAPSLVEGGVFDVRKLNVYPLPTVPPVPNTNTIAPICPSGSHLVGSKCVVDGAKCQSGLDGNYQEEDLCIKCPRQIDGTPQISDGGQCFHKLPVLPGSTTGSGGGFVQMFPR